MPETTALGTAMAAGAAEGVGVWSLNPENLSVITTDTFTPCIREKGMYTHQITVDPGFFLVSQFLRKEGKLIHFLFCGSYF
jgi:hypothetical protein